MITVKKFIPYKNIENNDKSLVYYPSIFSGKIITEILNGKKDENIRNLSVTIGLIHLLGKIFRKGKIQSSDEKYDICYLITENGEFIAKRKVENSEEPDIVKKCKKGDIFVASEFFRKNWDIFHPKSLIYYEDKILPRIYTRISSRFEYSNLIKRRLGFIHEKEKWKQCIRQELQTEILGYGSYANVFTEKDALFPYAIKISKIKEEFIGTDFTPNNSAWHEVFFLKYIFRPLLKKKICPNLPLLYDVCTCDKCSLKIDNKEQHFPCISTIVELASGNLRKYLDEERILLELKCALFQVMAGLYCIQYHAQIMNFDVKKENILFYNVNAGGFWQYTIRGKNYFIPNLGKLFILNDFGISRSMNPNYPMYKTDDDETFRLGSRYALIKDGKFIPISVNKQVNSSGKIVSANSVIIGGKKSRGAEFRMNRMRKVLGEGKLPKIIQKNLMDMGATETAKITPDLFSLDFFLHPDVIPPFEFYNDTQDAIRMFIGGKRTTQKGSHRVCVGVSQEFRELLKPYVGEGESHKNGIFSIDPAQVCAGYFIESFFSEFLSPCPEDKILEKYCIS